MNTAALSNKSLKHCTLLAVFVVCMVAAQLSAVQHSLQHPFHQHTQLCDSFIDFDHASTSITHSISLLIALERISIFYLAEIKAAFSSESATSRIRAPPPYS